MPTVTKKLDAGSYQLKDQVVSINRVTKVVKGGKNLSFAALVVVGDPAAAVVGFGSGKAKGNRVGEEEPVPDQPDSDHRSAHRGRALRLRQSTAEAGAGRHRSDRGRSGSGCHDVGGRAKRLHKIDRDDQSAQRHQGDLRCVEEAKE